MWTNSGSLKVVRPSCGKPGCDSARLLVGWKSCSRICEMVCMAEHPLCHGQKRHLTRGLRDAISTKRRFDAGKVTSTRLAVCWRITTCCVTGMRYVVSSFKTALLKVSLPGWSSKCLWSPTGRVSEKLGLPPVESSTAQLSDLMERAHV